MSGNHGGRLHKEDRRGGVPDIGRELFLSTRQPTTGSDSQSEDSWGDPTTARTRHPFISIILVLLVTVVVVATGIGIWLASLSRSDRSAGDSPATAPGLPAAADLSAADSRAAVETAVRGFLDAGNNLARCHWVIGGEETLGAMDEFYSRPDVTPPQSFGHILDIGPAAFDGFPVQMVMANEQDGVTGHLLSVFPVGDRMLIDWESSVGLGGMSWQQFLADKPTAPVQMRVYIKRSSYFNHGFADDSRWDSYRITARGFPDQLHGYAETNSDPGRQLRAIVLPGAVQPVNIRLHWADEGRALLITELLHNYWVDVERLRQISAGR